jgi:gluconolactonase
MTVLAERYNGKRFNGPNDVVVRSDGSIYFTDPEFGPFDKKPYEQGFEGLYRITPQGQLELLTRNINAPNGLAFSPDEKTLYLAVNSDDIKSWLAFDVLPDGKLGRSRTFFKAEGRGKKNADGLKVDKLGNLYCTGPTGLWVISPAGKHLGWIRPPELAANCAWGDPDGKTLYITAETGLYRIKLKNEGVRP